MNDKKQTKKENETITGRWDSAVDALSKSAYTTIMLLLERFGIFASAAVPAAALGYSLAVTLIVAADWNPYAAATVGFSAAYGLESYGLKSLRARFANTDNDELRKKSYIYLYVSISLLWFDAAVLIVDGLVGGAFDISGVAIAAAGTGFAILSYHYYGINGVETAIAETKEAEAVAKQATADALAQDKKIVADEKTAADALARAQKLEDDALEFKRKEAAKMALHGRTMEKQAAVRPSVAQPVAPSVNLETAVGLTPVQSSGSNLSTVRKRQLSVIYGRLADGQGVTADGIADMLSVTPRTARRIIVDGTSEGVLVGHGEIAGQHMKNGRHPSTL